jgi:leader peptidase (prepilin peptidase)/N-methyltransferase
LLGGKCRYCKEPISLFYLVLELSMAGILGVYAFLYGIPTGWYAFDYLILFALVALFFFDFKHQVLPDAIVFPLGLLVLLRLFTLRPDLLLNGVITGAVLAAVLGLMYAISRGRWLGFGDVKLAFVVGMLFSFPGAVGVTFIAVWAGALVGVSMIALKKMTMQSALPFGSFWVAVAILTILWPGPVFFLSGLIIPAF